MTLQQARLGGHTKECTQARIAWRANYRHLSEIERQRSVDAEVGRQVREAAVAVVGGSAEEPKRTDVSNDS